MNGPMTSLIAATFLCSLVAGFLFAFAVVVMPGIARLGDREFLRAFQVVDRVIQDNQPLFMLVWVGSVVALVTAVFLVFGQTSGATRWLLAGSLGGYLFGVQLPTVAVNVPLNNRLQAFEVDAADEASRAAFRSEFEGRWNASNVLRTVVACLVSITLIVVLSTM